LFYFSLNTTKHSGTPSIIYNVRLGTGCPYLVQMALWS